jgi:hypothetical protein
MSKCWKTSTDSIINMKRNEKDKGIERHDTFKE